jgi:plastocyanin
VARRTAAHIIGARMRRALTLLALGAFGLTGCGGGDDGGGSSGPATTVAKGKPVEVTADEFSFSPSKIVVEGGGPVEITLTNDGATAHDLRVEKDGSDVGGTPVFQGGGESKTATVDLEPGTYEFICSVPGHEAQGMRGTLEVK